MPRLYSGPPCVVCGKPSVARGLCETHYSRWRHHGHTEQTRPATWGKNSNHPLRDAWSWTRKRGRVPEWDDFWTFVRDVGERPPKHALRKHDLSKPAGPDNCYWAPRVSASVGDDRRAAKAAYQKAWRAANPARAKSNELRKMFGITLADYDAMLEAQGGGCAICGKPRDKHYRLAVDHDHASGKIRGLLCAHCNRGIGHFGDDPKLLRKAADYLSK